MSKTTVSCRNRRCQNPGHQLYDGFCESCAVRRSRIPGSSPRHVRLRCTDEQAEAWALARRRQAREKQAADRAADRERQAQQALAAEQEAWRRRQLASVLLGRRLAALTQAHGRPAMRQPGRAA